MRIIHPEPGFTGSASGIEFAAGEADVESLSDEARAVLADNGYTIDGVSAPAPAVVSGGLGIRIDLGGSPELVSEIVGEPADGEQITNDNAAIVEHENGIVEVGTITDQPKKGRFGRKVKA